MTTKEISDQLVRYKILALLIGSLVHEPGELERSLFALQRACGRPLKEFLLDADPNEDPVIFWQAIQALQALREDQIWIQRFKAGLNFPPIAWWS